MAVIAVAEDHKAWTGSRDHHYKRTYSRQLIVHTDSKFDGPAIILACQWVPQPGDVYATGYDRDNGARVKNVSCRIVDNDNTTWLVTVEYSSEVEESPENPLLREPEVSWEFQQFQKPAERDVNGNTITNSAGDPFDPAPEVDDSRPVLVVVKNEATFNEARAIQYQDAVNTDQFRGFEPNQAKIQSITGRKMEENNVEFWQVTYTVHFRREGWNLEILDRGYNEAGGTPIFDEKGQKPSQPPLLNGSGQKLESSGTPQYRTYQVYKERAFGPLGIEAS